MREREGGRKRWVKTGRQSREGWGGERGIEGGRAREGGGDGGKERWEQKRGDRGQETDREKRLGQKDRQQ